MSSPVAKRYARALFFLAEEANKTGIVKSIGILSEVLKKVPEMEAVCSNPSLSKENVQSVLKKIAEKLKLCHEVKGLLFVVAQKRRQKQLPQIVEYFEMMLAEQKNQVHLNVCSATPLSRTELTKISGIVQHLIQGKVIASNDVDPSILGGVVLQWKSKLIDVSYRNQLEQLTQSMKGV